MPPVIKQYRSNIRAGGASLGPGANARAVSSFRAPDQIDVFSGAASSLQQSIGQAVDIGIRQVAVERQLQLKDAAAYAGKTLADARLNWMTDFEAAKQSAKPDAAGFTDDINKRFSDFRQKTLDSAPNADARALLEERLPYLQADLVQDATRFEATTRVTYRRGQVVSAIESAQNAAFLQPERRGQILEEQIGMIDAAGLVPAEAEGLKKSARQSLADAAYRARAIKNPEAVLAALTDPDMKADGAADLDFGSRLQITNAAEGEIKRQRAERERAASESRAVAWASVQGRIEDELALRAAGKPVESPITRQQVAAAFKTREEADAAWQEISTKQRYATAAGQITGLPVDQQEQLLAEYQPGQGSGFADRQKLFQMLEREVGSNRTEGAKVIQDRLKNEIALRQRGEPVADPLSREDLLATIGQKGADAWADLQGTISRANAIPLVAGAGPAAQEALLDYTAPDPSSPDYAQQLEQQDLIRTAIDQDRKKREADPGGYAVATSPSALAAFQDGDIPGAVTASLAKQSELQIPADKQRPLPKAVASNIVAEISSTKDPATMVDRLSANVLSVRDPVAREQVLGQLIEAGLPKGSTYAVQAAERGDRESAVRIFTALQGPKPDLDTTTKKDLDAAITDSLQPRFDVLASISMLTGDQNAVGMASTDKDLVARIAGNQALATGDAYGAVDRAIKDLFGGDQPVQFDGGELASGLAPQDVDLDGLETRLEQIRSEPAKFLDRDSIRQAIGGAFPVAIGQDQAATAAMIDRMTDTLIEDAADSGRFVVDANGASFMLPIPRADGSTSYVRAKQFSYGELR